MIRASSAPARRAVDRLLLAGKPTPEACGCDCSLDLQRRIAIAVSFIVEAIGHLDRIPSTTIAGDQGPDAATLALLGARKALSALENEP